MTNDSHLNSVQLSTRVNESYGDFRQLLAVFRNKPNLEDPWPQFSSNKQAPSDWIVSDAV